MRTSTSRITAILGLALAVASPVYLSWHNHLPSCRLATHSRRPPLVLPCVEIVPRLRGAEPRGSHGDARHGDDQPAACRPVGTASDDEWRPMPSMRRRIRSRAQSRRADEYRSRWRLFAIIYVAKEKKLTR